ncbi:MAG: hypothetical protein LBT68_03750, partial [Spirochaetales bacterium]|nr:hypothetical protein [Spirochaetales bacterium]
ETDEKLKNELLDVKTRYDAKAIDQEKAFSEMITIAEAHGLSLKREDFLVQEGSEDELGSVAGGNWFCVILGIGGGKPTVGVNACTIGGACALNATF